MYTDSYFGIESALGTGVGFCFQPVPLSSGHLAGPRGTLFFNVIRLEVPRGIKALSDTILGVGMCGLDIEIVF